MPLIKMRRTKITTIFAIFVLSYCSTACSNDEMKSAKGPEKAQPNAAKEVTWDEDKLIITFSSGLNKGRYEYVASSRSSSGVALSFAKNNGPEGVTFFEARDIQSSDGSLQISTLKRTTSGELQVGDNRASTWQGNAITQGDECDEVNLAQQKGPQVRLKTYGKSAECNPTKIISVTAWRNVGSIHKERQVTGRFSDKVNFTKGQEKTVANMEVEFVITQKELRY